MRVWCCATAVLCGLVIASSARGQSTLAIRPASDRDGYSFASPDAGPFTLRPDGAGALVVGSGLGSGAGEFFRATMEFPLTGVLPTVSQATLTFHVEVVQNDPAAYRTHGFAGDGVVTAADMAINNEIAAIRSTADAHEVDVTQYVQSLVSQGASHAGITLSGFPGGRGFSITSSEPFVQSPILTITSIPEPASAGAVLLAGATMLGRRRRIVARQD